jgi:hypothetical protein
VKDRSTRTSEVPRGVWLKVTEKKESIMTTESKETKKINWETIKTITITAFLFTTLGLIGGYFTTINIHSEAREMVVKDMKFVQAPKEQK